MYCRKCGNKLPEEAEFCGDCGEQVIPLPEAQTVKIKKDHTIAILLGVLGTLVIILLSILIYLVYNYHLFPMGNAPVPVVSTVQSAEPAITAPPQTQTPKPAETAAVPESSPVALSNVNYDVRSDPEFDFDYAVPDFFERYNDGKNEHRYTAKAPDGSASLLVGARKSKGQTVRQSFEEYVSEHGEPEFEQQMEDRYTVRISRDGECYYKYCVFREGTVYWFEFIYDQAQKAVYEPFTKELYKHFELK